MQMLLISNLMPFIVSTFLRKQSVSAFCVALSVFFIICNMHALWINGATCWIFALHNNWITLLPVSILVSLPHHLLLFSLLLQLSPLLFLLIPLPLFLAIIRFTRWTRKEKCPSVGNASSKETKIGALKELLRCFLTLF